MKIEFLWNKKSCMNKVAIINAGITGIKNQKRDVFGLFSAKIQKKNRIILNLGNFYVTLQPELCFCAS